MKAYRILWVEDKPLEMKDWVERVFDKYFPRAPVGEKYGEQHGAEAVITGVSQLNAPGSLISINLPPEQAGQPEAEYLESLKKYMPFLDVETDIVKALERARDHAEDYLLFIVDRDLGKITEDIKGKIKGIWKDFNQGKKIEYAGDLLLEYLCLEKGMVRECKERVRFLTANEKQIKGLQDFLEAMHFPEELVGEKETGNGQQAKSGEMIVGKGVQDTEEPFKKLKAKVEAPVCFHLMTKHREALNALKQNADDLEITESDHVKNLIKALAYVEDVRLEGQAKPEPPEIDLLRALLEAFRRVMKERLKKECDAKFTEEKTLADYFQASFQELMNVNPKNDPQKNELAHWFNPSSYLGYHPKNNSNTQCKACEEIHKKTTRKLQRESFDFQQANEHYAHIDRLTHSITSQEIHHNDRPRFDGYRLQLVVYGICELLLFYQNMIKSEPITPTVKDRQLGRINDLLRFLDKDKDGWMECAALHSFSQYLADCAECNLDSLGFEVSENKRKFKQKENSSIS